ncbi:MAG: ATPase, T2SS/T4P/T4SS family [Chlamydiota bacterium]
MPLLENLLDFPFIREGITPLPYLFVKTHQILPLKEEKEAFLLATSSPNDLDGLEEVRLLLQKDIQIIVVEKVALEEAIQTCYRQKKEASENRASEEDREEDQELIEGYDLLEQSSQNPVIRLLNVIFMEAIGNGVSDIHFQPTETGLLVRFRIDGILQKRYQPPISLKNPLIVRIKVMAKLDIAETRLPQDGRLKLTMGGREVDFRVSTIPTHLGERVVLRLLDKSNIALGLSKINMPEKILRSFRRLIKSPEGILLVTGPTGSGKTTTLYSAIRELNAEEMNIMTVEDPVEYKLPLIAQIGINPKIHLTFSSGLRHILRQDPDIIMVGEIRDVETAEIAIQASLTGHLVLSTLHTNDAPSAVTRLVEMGIEPYLLSSSIIGVLAQRLVRKICEKCKEPYHPTEEERAFLPLKEGESLFYQGKGCSSCYHTGYLGRCAIYECMLVSPGVKRAIMQRASAEELGKEGLLMSLKEHGTQMALQGITTLAEVIRVVKTSVDGDPDAPL